MDSSPHDQNATVHADNAALRRELEQLWERVRAGSSRNDDPQGATLVVKGRQPA